MKAFILTAGLIWLGAIALQAQKTVEGTVTYSYEMKGPDGADLGSQAQMVQGMMPEKMTITYGNEGILTRMEGGMMAGMMGNMVVNNAKREVYILQASQKVAYVMNQEQMEEASPADPVKSVEKMDGSMEILGYDCQKYKMVMSQNGMELEQFVWVTSDLKLPEYDIPGIQQFNSGLMGGGKVPGFPMRTEVTLPGMNMQMVMMATGLEFAAVDPNLFERPADYTVKDFSELARSMMPPGGND